MMAGGILALCLTIGASVVNAQWSLQHTLPQSQTNGPSSLGTSNAPTLGPYSKHGTYLVDGYPWGNRTVAESCPHADMPDTYVTRYFDFTISRGTLAPDGVAQSMILVNGQFPGPTLEANWGDWIEVNVRNQISGPEEGTSLHWHGLDQRGTPWMDGVPTVGQCPIPSGHNFTYRFRADKYGSSWYHAHFSAQYSAGVLGPMVIHGPVHYNYDVDLGPVMLMDWYHEDYENIVMDVMKPGPLPINRPHADSNLIQGKGFYPCTNVTNGASCGNAGLATFNFTSGKQHKLRLVNAGGELFTTFSIDNHTITVVANDFVPIEPYETQFVTLGVGQRADIIVNGTGNPGQSYWMRSFNGLCGDPKAPDGRAVIFYEGANTTAIPTTTGLITPNNTRCLNDPLTKTTPIYKIPVVEPDITVTITMTRATNASNTTLWYMNNVAYEGDYNAPVLLNATSGVKNFPVERNLYDLGSAARTVRLIFYNTFLSGHPLHLHGHDFQVLAEGFGVWNGSITNPSNPQRRDVQQNAGGANAVPGLGNAYTVFQWTLDNPGVWPFHCHIAWHLSAGMNVLFGERLDLVAAMKPPQSVTDNCVAWSNWSSRNVVDQVDDGMRRRGAMTVQKKKTRKRTKVQKAADEALNLRRRQSVVRGRRREISW